jgi:hypothetical protein
MVFRTDWGLASAAQILFFSVGQANRIRAPAASLAWKSGRRRRIPLFRKLYRAPMVTAFIVISTHVLPGASPKLLSNDLSRLTLLSMTCLVSGVGVAPARKWRAVS